MRFSLLWSKGLKDIQTKRETFFGVQLFFILCFSEIEKQNELRKIILNLWKTKPPEFLFHYFLLFYSIRNFFHSVSHAKKK